MQTKQPSKKAFLESVEEFLASGSADELRGAVRRLAEAAPAAQRRAFLRRLEPADAGRVARASSRKGGRSEALLEAIDDLLMQIEETAEMADEWEDERAWWGGYYDDEDSPGQYEKFVKPTTVLFRRTQTAFGRRDWSVVRQAYPKLFDDVLSFEDDFGRGLQVEDLPDVNAIESRARYLRAVYESEQLDQRAAKLLDAMQQVSPWLAGPVPKLSEIIKINPAPLPDWQQFLENWTALMRKQKGQTADAWLREAVQLAHGTAGLGELARSEGRKRPRAFLDWCVALAAEGKHDEAMAAAQLALRTLPSALPIRAAVADQLCAAALRLGDQAAFRAGRWETFLAAPTLTRLLNVWDSISDSQERRKQMQKAARHIAGYLKRSPAPVAMFDTWPDDDLDMPVFIEKPVLAHAHLLAGDLAAARALAARHKVLGWSYGDNPRGLVLALSLVVLAGKGFGDLPPTLRQVWRSNPEATLDVDDGPNSGSAEAKQRSKLEGIYAVELGGWAATRAEQAALLRWRLGIIRKRADAIVGEKHRRSYNKAAALAAAGAEVLRLRGDAGAAQALVDDLYERCPRHRAFLAELGKATGRSRRKTQNLNL